MGKDSNWGYLPYLTPEQKEVLAALRRRVDEQLPKKPWLAKDTELLRFCRARNFNLEKTWTMLKEDVEWREPFEGYVFCKERDFGGAYVLHEEGAIRLGGRSKDGRPVLLVQARNYWPKLVEDNMQIVYFFQFYVDHVCRLAEEVNQETFLGIFDLQGFSMSNFSLSQMKVAISILQNHYPERLGRIFVINAPFVFTAAWKLVQPLLDERTRSKIDILGKNYLEAISEDIPLDQLEVSWGGTHEPFPVPDPIVQIAIDNEKRLIEEQKRAKEEAAAAAAARSATENGVLTAEAPPSSLNPLARTSSGGPPTDAKKPAGMRRRVRKMLNRMLSFNDKRALATTLGEDPDALVEPPKRLTTGGSLGTPRRMLSRSANSLDVSDIDSDVIGDLEKDLLEVKVEHDKLLAKIERLENSLVSERAAFNKTLKSLQVQLFILAVIQIIILGVLFRAALTSAGPSSTEL